VSHDYELLTTQSLPFLDIFLSFFSHKLLFHKKLHSMSSRELPACCSVHGSSSAEKDGGESEAST